METALRHEIVKAIPELTNQMYPTNAPEEASRPYLVYQRSNTTKLKTLEGYSSKEDLSFVFNIMAIRYSDMVRIRKLVEVHLISLTKTEIGDEDKFYVEDLNINNIEEQFEHQLGVNRGIVDFTIYFKKREE